MQKVRAQPLIAVRDVRASSHFYTRLLGAKSGHGGELYEQVMFDGELVLQIHAWDQEDHPNLSNPKLEPHGHGVLVWFHISNFEHALNAIAELKAEVVERPHVNPNSLLHEVWIRDPDGYVVVLSSESE